MTEQDAELQVLEEQLAANPNDVAVQKKRIELLQNGNWTFENRTVNDLFFDSISDNSDWLFEYDERIHVFDRIGAKGLPFLLRLLGDEWAPACWTAGIALAHMPEYAEEITTQSAPLLTHSYGMLRRNVRWVLGQLAPASTPTLARLLHTMPSLRSALLDAIGYQGPLGASALPALETLEVSNEEERALVQQTIQAVRGPWPLDPEAPVPYLGEHVRFDLPGREIPESEIYDRAQRKTFALDFWCDLASSFVRYQDSDAGAEENWTPELEAACAKAFDKWTPHQVVVARTELTLSFYNWNTDGTTEHVVRSDEPLGFTMEELLYKLVRTYDKHACANDRIFEGLKFEEPGKYYINTGS